MPASVGKTKEDWLHSATWIDDPSADIDAYVAGLRSHERPSYDLRQKLIEWRDHGVVIFEQVVDPDLIDRVNADFDTVMNDHAHYHLPIDGSMNVAQDHGFLDRLSATQVREWNIRLVDFHAASRQAALLSAVPDALSFLTHVFGEAPALLQSLTFPRGSEQTVHQDFAYVFRQAALAQLAAFWIPLEDIHPDAGPLAYYRGSHQVERVGFFDWGGGAINQFDRYGNVAAYHQYEQFLESRIQALNLEPVHFLPRKGDLLIWHGALIHAGSPIRNRALTRRSYVGHYTGVSGHHKLAPSRVHGGFVFNFPERADVSGYRTWSIRERVEKKGRGLFR